MLNAEVTKILFENEELKAERDTLAGLVAKLRGAAQYALEECVDLIGTEEGKRLQTALSLPLPDAAERVKAWREKAELLDMLLTLPQFCEETCLHFANTFDPKLDAQEQALAALRAAKEKR